MIIVLRNKSFQIFSKKYEGFLYNNENMLYSYSFIDYPDVYKDKSGDNQYKHECTTGLHCYSFTKRKHLCVRYMLYTNTMAVREQTLTDKYWILEDIEL